MKVLRGPESTPFLSGRWVSPIIKKRLPLGFKEMVRARFSGAPFSLLRTMRGIKGWLTEDEAVGLYRFVKATPSPRVAIEIGSWLGKSSVMIAAGIRDGGGGCLYAVDPFEGDDGSPTGTASPQMRESFIAGFTENIRRAGLADYVLPLLGYSHEIAGHWLKPVDFLFIDGDHAYESVKRDFEDWSKFVKRGGYLAFHDSNQDGPGKVIHEGVRAPAWEVVQRIDSLTVARRCV